MAALRIAGWLLPLILLAAAEAALRITGIQRDGLALPSDIWLAFVRVTSSGALERATGETLFDVLLGTAIGGGLGLLAGIWFGLSRAARRLSALSVELFRPIPPVALIPLSLLIFGWGWSMETFVVAFATFWPMLILTQAAVVQIHPRLIEVGQVLQLSPDAMTRKVVLPAATPRIFVALRLTVGIALIVAITTEIAANPHGIGNEIVTAQRDLQPAEMYAYVLWLALIGFLISTGLLALQRRLFGDVAGGGGLA